MLSYQLRCPSFTLLGLILFESPSYYHLICCSFDLWLFFLSFDVKCSMFMCSFSRIFSFISYLWAQLNPVKPIFHSTVVHILASNIDSRSIEWSYHFLYHFILIHLPPFYSPSHFLRRSFRNADSIHSVYRIPARSDDRRQVDSREVLRTLRPRKIRELRWIPCRQRYELCIIFQSYILIFRSELVPAQDHPNVINHEGHQQRGKT